MSIDGKTNSNDQLLSILEINFKNLDLTSMNHQQLTKLLVLGQKIILTSQNQINELNKIKLI